jgi:HEAT repeat protein
MGNYEDRQINDYLQRLDDEDQDIRLDAIHHLGETGDVLCLKELRERLKYLSKEHLALIMAIGKLKADLGIK